MAANPSTPAVLFLICLGLAGCQTVDSGPGAASLTSECAQGKLASRALAKVTGVALGLAGVPGGGLAGRAVGYATNPACDLVRPGRQPAAPLPKPPPAQHASSLRPA